MSADDGVYIFRTRDQIRVGYAKAIDNLKNSFCDPDFAKNNPGKFVPTRVIEFFGECEPYTGLVDAVGEAENILAAHGECEYGISLFPVYPCEWSELVNEAKEYAKRELAVLVNCANRSDFSEDIRILSRILSI